MNWRSLQQGYSLSVVAFWFLLLTASIGKASWCGTIGIVLVLAIHYAKSLIPARLGLGQDDVKKAIDRVADLDAEVTKLQVAAGFKSIRSPKP